ncbi:hypothetical protein Scep_016893 [Stephania cephalantha]|uniref:Uncharacterized protein n=1 Tax=Stephania cephalantha TaxID=152367 RepID=A0AAP0IPG2_9MAGN
MEAVEAGIGGRRRWTQRVAASWRQWRREGGTGGTMRCEAAVRGSGARRRWMQQRFARWKATTMAMDSATAVRRGVRRMKGGGAATVRRALRDGPTTVRVLERREREDKEKRQKGTMEIGLIRATTFPPPVLRFTKRSSHPSATSSTPQDVWMHWGTLYHSTCDHALGELQPELHSDAHVVDSADLANAARTKETRLWRLSEKPIGETFSSKGDEPTSLGQECPPVSSHCSEEGNHHFNCPWIFMSPIPAIPLWVRAPIQETDT